MSDTRQSSDILREERVCEKHGPYTAEGHQIGPQLGGHIFWSGCEACMAEVAAEREAKLAEMAERAEKDRLSRAGITGRLCDMTLEAYHADTAEQDNAFSKCRGFAEDPDGTLVLIGGVGTGKTHLGVAIARANGGTYSTLMRMIRNIRETYRGDCKDTEQKRIDEWAGKSLLVLDEVGVQHCTEAEQLLAYEILNERYVAELPTVLISNETIQGMGKILGERVMDRLAEKGKVVAFTWQSYRRQKHEA